MHLKEKVALVIGGATGIGASCVEELLRNGIKGVVIADSDNAEELIKQFKDEYGDDKIVFVKTDVVDRNSLKNAFEKTIETYNNIDILINSAAIFNERQWELVIQTNLIATAHACDLAISTYFPKYKSSTDAFIINIASIAGIIPVRGAPHYTASRHGVVGLSRAYGITAQTGVCVMAICQGLTDIPLAKQINASMIVYGDKLPEDLAMHSVQKPDAVAKGLMEILRKPESGSVWVVSAGKLSKMELTSVQQIINL